MPRCAVENDDGGAKSACVGGADTDDFSEGVASTVIFDPGVIIPIAQLKRMSPVCCGVKLMTVVP